MRGLEDALARIARRDELRERATARGSHRVEPATAVTPVVDEVTEALQNVVKRNPGVFATVVVQEADTAWSVWIGEWDGTIRTRVTRLEDDPLSLVSGAGADPGSDGVGPEGSGGAAPAAVDRPTGSPAGSPFPPPAHWPGPVPLPRRPLPDRTSPVPARAGVASAPGPAAGSTAAGSTAGVSTAAGSTAAGPDGDGPGPGHAAPAVDQPVDDPSTTPRFVGPAMNDRVAGRIAALLHREAMQNRPPDT